MTSTLINHRSSKRRQRRSVDEWRVVFEDFERSGLSQAAYCQQEGLAVATFCKWLARLRGGEAAKPVKSAPAPFVEVDRRPIAPVPISSAVDTAVTIHLDLGAGIVLEVNRA